MTDRTIVESLTPRRVLAVPQESSAYEAACLMSKARCGSILIVDPDGTLLGIFTERDLMNRVVAHALAPDRTPLSEVMTHAPRTIGPEASVSDAVLIMKEHGFRHLPVLSSSGKILGVFSLRDALPQEMADADRLAEHMDQQFSNVLA